MRVARWGLWDPSWDQMGQDAVEESRVFETLVEPLSNRRDQDAHAAAVRPQRYDHCGRVHSSVQVSGELREAAIGHTLRSIVSPLLIQVSCQAAPKERSGAVRMNHARTLRSVLTCTTCEYGRWAERMVMP